MKKQTLFFIILFSVFIPLCYSFAELQPAGFGSPIGTQSNPIYVQVKTDPMQVYTDAVNKAQSIQYVSACANTYDTIRTYISGSLNADMGNPSVQTSRANYLNYLYSSYQSCVSRASQSRSQNTGINGNTLNDICQQSIGANSVYTGVSYSTGRGTGGCSCKAGYSWDSDTNRTACVPTQQKPQLTSDQICKNHYGSNSFWTSDVNEQGGPICDCAAGYQWNQGQTQCVIIPKKASAVAPKAPTPKKEVKIEVPREEVVKESVASSSENVPVVVTSNSMVAASVEAVKPKGLWAIIKSWFGF